MKSYLIGTKDQLLSFAKTIINAVESAKPDEFFGEQVLASKLIHGKLDSKAEMQLDEVVVVESDEQNKRCHLQNVQLITMQLRSLPTVAGRAFRANSGISFRAMPNKPDDKIGWLYVQS